MQKGIETISWRKYTFRIEKGGFWWRGLRFVGERVAPTGQKKLLMLGATKRLPLQGKMLADVCCYKAIALMGQLLWRGCLKSISNALNYAIVSRAGYVTFAIF
jgi:hypothetical protein